MQLINKKICKAFFTVVLHAITNIFTVKKVIPFSHFDTHKLHFLITVAIQNCYF